MRTLDIYVYVIHKMEYYSVLKWKEILSCIMDESWRHQAKWNKPVIKRQILCDVTYTNPRVVKFTETESRMVVARAEMQGK